MLEQLGKSLAAPVDRVVQLLVGQEVGLFFGKIDRGLNIQPQPRYFRCKLLDHAGKRTRQGPQRRTRCLLGPTADQVSHSLCLRQVQPVVEKRTLCEFARRSDARAASNCGIDHQLHDHGSTVPVQLNDVLARERRWSWKIQDESAINCVARGVLKYAMTRSAWLRQLADHLARNVRCHWPGNTHDADSAGPRRRCGRDNRVNVLRHVPIKLCLLGRLAALLLLVLRRDNLIDLPLLCNGQQCIRHPVEHEPRREECEEHREN